MWIRNAEDLRAHLDDPASREGLVVDYKKDVDKNKKKGIAADVVETVCAMANAQGGQVLVGVDEVDGAPTEVCGVASADDAQKGIEAAMDSVLRLAEPRPRVWVLEFDGKGVVIVDVHPSVRLASIWRTAERNKIVYPVRTGQGTDYMRPGDVEARVLTYGPRAQRIVLEQLLERTGDDRIQLFHTYHSSGTNIANSRVVLEFGSGEVYVEKLEHFGLNLSIRNWTTALGLKNEEQSVWTPYDWTKPFLTQVDGKPRVALLLSAQLSDFTGRLSLVPMPAMG